MKYWVTDLRPSMDNNVPVSQEDPATWQHMDTYGIALTAGTSTTQPSAWQDPTSYANLGGPVAIDDLWHAALSGHGQFMLATQGVTDLTSALQSVLTNITGRMGSAAAVAVSNANVTAGDNTSYASSYNSGTWTGDLQSYTVDTVSGNVATVTSWATSAQSQLDALTATMTASSSRHIGTFDGTSGVSFSTSGLTSAMQSRLDTPSLSDWSGVLSYIRGVNNSAYRNRSHVLGDIINAEPVPVSAPMLSYADTGYSAFKSANAGRIKVIYQGANDGMLHAFDAASGAEAWAYVPGVLFNTPLSATNPTTSSLVNLSLASGYKHMDYVDATPVEGDVDFGNTIASATTPLSTSYSPAWHSILVGGLGAGGSGYFALDVTSASGASDAAVANKVLWEFPKASNSAAYSSEIGLSYGKPILVKTAAAGWVVLLTSGYNNADGINHLFVLNPQTGAVLSDIVTASGHGLAHIAAYAQKGMTDNTATAVYGGDLDGNVWKFDFSGATVASWQASLLASLHDDNGVAQPVTTTPELASINGNPVVYVGTGQYLGNSDVPDMPGGTPNSHAAQTQSMYALADTGSPIPDVRGNTMVQQSLSTGSTTVTLAVQQPMSFSSKQGWYVDFTAQGASSGERVVTDPYLADGVLMFTTNMPSGANPCSPGGSSWLYNLDFSTGGAVTMPGSSAPAVAGQYLGTVLASRPAVVSLPGGKVVEIIRKSDATTSSYQAPISATSIGGRKVSWQEIM
jgi:type IV pilus assembly protein PilY1